LNTRLLENAERSILNLRLISGLDQSAFLKQAKLNAGVVSEIYYIMFDQKATTALNNSSPEAFQAMLSLLEPGGKVYISTHDSLSIETEMRFSSVGFKDATATSQFPHRSDLYPTHENYRYVFQKPFDGRKGDKQAGSGARGLVVSEEGDPSPSEPASSPAKGRSGGIDFRSIEINE